MHPFELAQAAAAYLVGELCSFCVRIEIAGSIRRGARLVKDIEVVAQATIGKEPEPGKLFGETRPFDFLERKLQQIAQGRHHAILKPKVHAGRTAPWGPRYKKLWVTHGARTFAVDLFQTTASTWGPTLVLRTGPAEFSRLLVTQRAQGGAMPAGMRQHECRLERGSRDVDGELVWSPVETPDEASYFAALGVPLWEPHERTEGRLLAWLRDQGVAPPAPPQPPQGDYSPYRSQARGVRPPSAKAKK